MERSPAINFDINFTDILWLCQSYTRKPHESKKRPTVIIFKSRLFFSTNRNIILEYGYISVRSEIFLQTEHFKEKRPFFADLRPTILFERKKGF